MASIMRLYLRAKHWEIFTLLIGLPVFFGFAFDNFESAPEPISVAFNFFFILCNTGWSWAAGTFLNSLVTPELRLNSRAFQVLLCFPFIYLTVSLLAPLAEIAPMLALIFVMIVASIYLASFVANALVCVETGRRAAFSDYAGPFFLLLFFPIGIWFIQPRISQIYVASLIQKPELQQQT